MRKVLIFIVLLAMAIGAWWYFAAYKTGKTIPQAAKEISFPLVGNVVNRITGTGNGYSTGDINSDGSTSSTATDIKKPRQQLEQLVPTPVAGFYAFTVQKPTVAVVADTAPVKNVTAKAAVSAAPIAPAKIDFSTNKYIRYVSRNNGYVYEIANDGVPTQISNIYIPNIYEAFFADTGKKAFLRFLRDDQRTIATFAVPIPEPNIDGSRSQADGVFLPDNIKSFAVSPDTNLIAMLGANSTGGSLLTVADTNNRNRKDIMSNSFHDWLISWTAQDRVSVQTKAAGTVEGNFYGILQRDIRLKKVLSNIYGLTASISPSGNYVLYSQTTKDSFITKVYQVNTGTTTTLAVRALPEKCVWTLNEDAICATDQDPEASVYPDAWYAGLTHFSDKIIRINLASGFLNTLYDGETTFDAINLQFDEANNQLYFINKNDGSLWRLNSN